MLAKGFFIYLILAGPTNFVSYYNGALIALVYTIAISRYTIVYTMDGFTVNLISVLWRL